MKIAGLFPQNINIDARLDPDPEEPLGIEYVLSAVVLSGHKAKLFTSLDAPLESISDLIVDYHPEVLAISLYTCHVPNALMIASKIKKQCPDTIVIVGGPHPSADQSIVLNQNIDYAVIGEGEETFCNLLYTLENRLNPYNVNGIAFAEQNRIVVTTSRKRITNLDLLPYPFYERRYYDLPAWSVSYPPMSKVIYAPMIFSRGCNMLCKFCSSRELWGGIVYSRKPENVIKEIKYLRDVYGVNYIYFEDLTFTLKRKMFLYLCELMQNEKLGISWGCETHLNTVTSSDLETMKKAGCNKILWGVENLDDNNLNRLGKKQNINNVRQSLENAANNGILNWGCYIIGFPWETEGDILKVTADLSSLDIHQLRISIATPFPGSDWHKEMPVSSLNPDLSLYDTNHLVYEHPTITPERMKELQNEVFIRFYRSTKYRNKVAKMIKQFPYLRDSFDEFLSYIDSNIELLKSGQTEITKTYITKNTVDDKICV